MTRGPGPGVASPCNSVCRIDDRSGLCQGCWRTLDEIARWSAMADEDKLALRGQLLLRRRAARDHPQPDGAPP